MTSVPQLETERLILRGFALDDFEFYRSVWADPDIVTFVGGRVRTEEDSWLKFHSNAGYWVMHGIGQWVIVEKLTGNLMGQCGFMKNRRGLSPDISHTMEIGWVLSTAAQGQGIAGEAVDAALRWSDRRFGDAVTCIIHPHNKPSIRLAERAGFSLLADAQYHGEPTLIFRREPVRR
ncbi:MAG: GNAT family N-acetyltransferase [Pseudomonadota bacterium]